MSEVEKLLPVNRKVSDRYLKREVLGEGTYGVVYKAIDTKVSFMYTFLGVSLVFFFSFGVFWFCGF